MGAFSLSPLHRFAGYAPLVIRVIAGIVMATHGWQKLMGGPAAFGEFLGSLGVPLPGLMAYVVILAELGGGILLILGLLSRWAGLILTINLAMAILLVKTQVGFIAPADQPGVGAELDLALIAGFVTILLAGPGKVSLDHVLGIEGDLAEIPPLRRAGGTGGATA